MEREGWGRWAPLAYLLIAVPVMLFVALAAPPFQGADEDNHFLRVIALSRGEVVGTRFSDFSAGGFVNRTAVAAAHALDRLKFHPERHVTAAELLAVRGLRWRGAVGAADFGNTALYPPWFYGPAVVAVLIARAGRMPVVDGLLLARVLTGLAGAGVGALAIGMARRGRAIVFGGLALPMSLALLGSCSQDGLLIATAALAAALLGRGRHGWAGLLLGLVVAARPPYAPLLLLLGLGWPGRRALAVAVLAAALPLLWIAFGAAPAEIALRPADGVSIAGQLRGLLAHPARVPGIAMRTLVQSGAGYWRELLGVLGWLDTPLAGAAYRIADAMLAAALAVQLAGPGEARPRWVGAAVGLVILAAMGAVFAAQYLSWTPVGAARVEGVQGRYLIPVLLFLGLALPGFGRLSWARAGWAWLYAAAAASWWFVPMAIMARYYG